jgi:hypothetical protein
MNRLAIALLIGWLFRHLTNSNAKPFRYSVSGIEGMMGWSGDWL